MRHKTREFRIDGGGSQTSKASRRSGAYARLRSSRVAKVYEVNVSKKEIC